MKTLTAILAMLILSGCGTPREALPFYDAADFTPHWDIPANGAFHVIRPFTLTDQNGSSFTEQDIHGRIAIVNFFFTSCTTVCPKTIQSMSAIQKEFLDADDVILMSHSVMPGHDSAAVLHEFAQSNNVDARRWKLLTGSEQEIYDLGRHYYFLDDDQGETSTQELFTHTENIVLMDQQRRLRGVYNGMDPSSMEALARDVRLLQQRK